MRKLLVLLLVMMLLPVPGVLAENLSVAFSGAELRTAPSVADSKVIFKAPRFYPVRIIETGPEYDRVSDYRGRIGWLHKSLLQDVPTTVITGDRANVRKGPGTGQPALFQLEKGSSCRVLDRSDAWVRIECADGRTGWVADFLTWTP